MKWGGFFGGNDEFTQVVKDKDTDRLETLFEDRIIGYDKEKIVIRQVFRARDIIHPLLHGDPGTGKTLFGECINDSKLFKGKVELRTGARMSKAGLSDLLIKRGKNMRVLIIDEIEYLPKPDQALLLSLMSTGNLEVTISGKDKKIALPQLIVMATCNNPSKLLKPLFDRFFKVKMEAYTPDQFTTIARTRLTEYELPHNIIESIIEIVLEMEGPNMRRAVDVAKLRPHTRDEIVAYLEVSK